MPPLTPKQMSNFEKYNKVDIELYNFFNASLHEKIDAFGRVVGDFQFDFFPIRFVENEDRNHPGEKGVSKMCKEQD